MAQDNTPWPSARDARLAKLWAEETPRLSTAEIGRRLGTTKNAVIGRARRLGLPPRKSPIKRAHPLPPRVPRPAPRVAARSEARVPEPDPVPVVETRAGCLWPMWPDGARRGHPSYGAFCGRVRARGSYCVEHAARAYAQRAA